jgi:hypothetical protein
MTTKEFWIWFESYSINVSEFGNKNSEERESSLDLITKKLHQYCDSLYPLMSYKKDENTIIITANGEELYFDEVEKLVVDAPKIRNWNIVGFSPKVDFDKLDYHDLCIKKEEVKFLPWEFPEEPKTVAFYIYINDYENKSKSEWLSLAMQKFLVLLLGEKKYVETVNFYTINDLNQVKNARNIDELEQYIDIKSQ